MKYENIYDTKLFQMLTILSFKIKSTPILKCRITPSV